MHLLRSFAHPNPSLIRLSLATLLACAIGVVAAETPRADQDMQNFDWLI